MSEEPAQDAPGADLVQRLTEHLDQAAADQSSGADSGPFESAVVAALRSESTWHEPPADLRATVLVAALRASPPRTVPSRTAAPQTAALQTAALPVAPPQATPSPTALRQAAPESIGQPIIERVAEPVLTPAVDPVTGPVTGPVGDHVAAPVGDHVAAGTPHPRRRAAPTQSQGRTALLRRLRWAVPATAVAAAALTVVVLSVERALEPTEAAGTSYAAAGTPLAPGAAAKITIASAAAGFHVVIAAHDLPAAAPGSYYAAWLFGPRGIVGIGSFHGRKTGRPIEMWSGVDPAQYPMFEVTLQQEGAPSTPSTLVVLTARLAP